MPRDDLCCVRVSQALGQHTQGRGYWGQGTLEYAGVAPVVPGERHGGMKRLCVSGGRSPGTCLGQSRQPVLGGFALSTCMHVGLSREQVVVCWWLMAPTLVRAFCNG